MTDLEELAARVKDHEPGAMLELWEAVRRFVKMRARGYIRAGSRVPLDDLMQTGFFAVLDAADKYDPDKENASFLSLLDFCLLTRWAEESGIRTTKRDALQYANSLNVPAVAWDENSAPAINTTIDESAALALVGVEYRDFLQYCRNIIAAALDTLSEAQADILRLHYLEGKSLEETAALCGISSKQAASDTEFKALCRLERGKYRRELRDCLDAFGDYEAALLDRGDRSINRWTETTALIHIEGRTL